MIRYYEADTVDGALVGLELDDVSGAKAPGLIPNFDKSSVIHFHDIVELGENSFRVTVAQIDRGFLAAAEWTDGSN